MIEENMKITSGLRRMGVMGHEVASLEAMIEEGKTTKEIADHFQCDESVVEGFRKPVPASDKAYNFGKAEEDEDEEDEEKGKGRGKRK